MTLPEDFTIYNKQLMGDALAARLAEGLQQEPLVSIRLNPFKTEGRDARLLVEAEPVPWCQGGYYLRERPNFTFDPLFHAGAYYVQEASSMFLDHVLRELVHEPVEMLDLCAAPGGKTTCAMAALPRGSKLYSNEPIAARAQILLENVTKFGCPDITVTNAYADDYRREGLSFDVILTDVPCSGEGMFRKDEGAIREWSPANVEKCWRLQRDIVETIWPCLRPGGLLIYSTCTFNAHEDEENVNWIAEHLGADFVTVPTDEAWGITGSLIDDHPVYRFLPGVARGEGLFMAVLRKREESLSPGPQSLSPSPSPVGRGVISLSPSPSPIGRGVDSFSTDRIGTKKKEKIKNKDKRKYKGKDQVRTSSLQSKVLTPLPIGEGPGERLPGERLSGERLLLPFSTALSYLQGQSIVLPADAPRGVVTVCYEGLPLGQVKNLGTRANNLYPKPWRIRTTHLPDQETKIIQL